MTLRGSTGEFPLESVIGLLAGTSKTGELQVRSGGQVGALGFAGGRLVAAVIEGEGGENALGAVFAISEADFEFTSWASPPEPNLEPGDLVALLKRAAEARDRITAIREAIPDDRIRFRLSEKAADSGAVTFTPDRWRALLVVNGERDVPAIAEQLRLGKMQTLGLLAGLVREGVIEAVEAPAPPPVTAAEARRAEPPPVKSEPEPAAPPPQEWAPAQPAPDWGPSETVAESPAPSGQPEPRSTPAPDWTTSPPEKPRSAATSTEVRAELQAELAERLGGSAPAREGPAPAPVAAPAADVPPAVDDRLSTLTGLFAPGPAANVPSAAPGEETRERHDHWTAPSPSPGRPAESWMTAPPEATEAPANTWAPTAPPQEPATAAAADPWALPAAPATPAASATPKAPPLARAPGGTPPSPQAEAPAEKKRGGFLARFRREEPAPAPTARMDTAAVASRSGLLASLSNALLMEYNSGTYGKGKLETHLANLLMRVDEQADPIDRPLPVVDDLIDAAALEREGLAEAQTVPYLATLIRQIYEDAERAFGKDKAKKGYKAAQQQVVGADSSALHSSDLAGKLPRV